MASHLVVGNQTLGSRELFEELRKRAEAETPCRIHVVVPQTPLDHYRHPVEGASETVAEHRLSVAIEEFGRLDAEVTGSIGDERPLKAVEDAVANGDYDEVILSTFPEGISRWLSADLTHQVQRHVQVPVMHVVAKTIDKSREADRRYLELVRAMRASENPAEA